MEMNTHITLLYEIRGVWNTKFEYLKDAIKNVFCLLLFVLAIYIQNNVRNNFAKINKFWTNFHDTNNDKFTIVTR